MFSRTKQAGRLLLLLCALPTAGAGAALALRRVVLRAAEAVSGHTTTPSDERVAAVLVVVSAAGALLAWCWLVLCVLACLDDFRGGSAAGWGLGRVAALQPPVIHRMVRRFVGAATVPALLTPVMVAPAAGVAAAHEHPPLPGALSGLPLPDRVVGEAQRRGRYRIIAGDTLWGIAAARLPPGSPDPVVDRTWRWLFALNRSVLGPDPDLITPGVLLRLPLRRTGSEN